RPRRGAPWRRGRAPLVELPIAVTPYGRVPVIGTNLLLAPAVLRDHWLRAMSRRSLFNFELHGIDLADANADRMPAELVARQPDLRVPLSRKLTAFEAVLDRVCARFDIAPLCDIAADLDPVL
ncbi:MAG: polysaccharide deacetylase, partial [Myxococcota bacterium]